MRLRAAQIRAAKQKANQFFGAQAEVWLFGPCVDGTQSVSEESVLIVRAAGGELASAPLARGAAFQRGFTLVELVTIMVIIGILAVAAMPRMFDRNTFDSRGFYDQVISTLRYAQKTAISQRRLVCVTFPSTSRIVLRTTANFADADCNTNGRDLQNPSGSYPAGQTTYTVDAPSGVTLGGAVAFNFDALGRTNGPVAQMTVGSYTINVAQETGYVR